MGHQSFDAWLAASEERQLADLQFSEVSRALRALSSAYVERRGRIARGGALDGNGKRAAFALFYAPLHYLLVREIVTRIDGATDGGSPLLDLGCGTGAAGAAWAAARRHAPAVTGIDRHPWALEEAARTYRAFGLKATTIRRDVKSLALPKRRHDLIAAYTLNELDDAGRDGLLTRLLEAAANGSRALIVEPLARGVAPWWPRWQDRVEQAGGRGDEWRFRAELPPIVQKLDRAAGLDHRELTGRSLWISGG